MEKPQKLNGRPPLQDGKRNKMVNVRFTEEEFQSILELETELGISRTDLIRSRLLHQSHQRVVNAKKLISHLDLIGAEMARAGNNINQLARYANILRKQNVLSGAVIERFNHLLESYLRNQADLEAALRKVIRMMTQT
jgi:hypothetical protein